MMSRQLKVLSEVSAICIHKKIDKGSYAGFLMQHSSLLDTMPFQKFLPSSFILQSNRTKRLFDLIIIINVQSLAFQIHELFQAKCVINTAPFCKPDFLSCLELINHCNNFKGYCRISVHQRQDFKASLNSAQVLFPFIFDRNTSQRGSTLALTLPTSSSSLSLRRSYSSRQRLEWSPLKCLQSQW